MGNVIQWGQSDRRPTDYITGRVYSTSCTRVTDRLADRQHHADDTLIGNSYHQNSIRTWQQSDWHSSATLQRHYYHHTPAASLLTPFYDSLKANVAFFQPFLETGSLPETYIRDQARGEGAR